MVSQCGKIPGKTLISLLKIQVRLILVVFKHCDMVCVNQARLCRHDHRGFIDLSFRLQRSFPPYSVCIFLLPDAPSFSQGPQTKVLYNPDQAFTSSSSNAFPLAHGSMNPYISFSCISSKLSKKTPKHKSLAVIDCVQ